jgi:hypothetical protein
MYIDVQRGRAWVEVVFQNLLNNSIKHEIRIPHLISQRSPIIIKCKKTRTPPSTSNLCTSSEVKFMKVRHVEDEIEKCL